MNETQFSYCDKNDKTINVTSKLRPITSIIHIHKNEYQLPNYGTWRKTQTEL